MYFKTTLVLNGKLVYSFHNIFDIYYMHNNDHGLVGWKHVLKKINFAQEMLWKEICTWST